MHALMAYVRSGKSVEWATHVLEAEFDLSVAELRNQWAASHENDPDPGKCPDFDEERKTFALGVMMGQVLAESFPLEAGTEVLAVEQSIELPLHPFNLSGMLTGTIDCVLREKDGQVWIEDFKSTSKLPRDRAMSLPFDVQTRLYRALWEAAHPDTPAYGAIHTIIQKPSIRQRTARQPETLDEYVQRAREDLANRALATPNTPPVLRSYVPYREHLSKDTELLNLLKQRSLISTCPPRTLEDWPRCGASHICDGWGNSEGCPYISLCRSEPPQWPSILTREGFRVSAFEGPQPTPQG
jgi:hypothetical protein